MIRQNGGANVKRIPSKYLLAALCVAGGISLLGGCQGPEGDRAQQTYEGPEASAPDLQAEGTEASETGIIASQPEEMHEAGTEEGNGPETEKAATSQEDTQQPEPEQTEAAQEGMLPEEFPKEFLFCSGAGAWGTTLAVNRDGSFEGHYHDSEMGEQGEGYPNGSVYISNFSGTFTNIKKVNGHTWSMTLGEVDTQHEVGEEWIEEEIRYVASVPYGLDGGKEFLLYLPQTPVEELDELFLSWWPNYYPEETRPETLSCYGIYNVEAESGFFTW